MSVVDLSQFASHHSASNNPEKSASADAGAGAHTSAYAGADGARAAGGQDIPAGSAHAARVVHAPIIVEVNKDSLQEVLSVSQQLTVFVIFHSAHEPSSATLLDIFQRLAMGAHGKYQVASVDVDAEREVAAAFGVQVVPTAVALLQGQPLPLFQGCPDEQTISQTVEQVLQAAQQYGLSAVLDVSDEDASQPKMPPLHQEGFDALQRGDLEKAHQAFAQALRESPADDVAQAALHQVELDQRVQALGADASSARAQEIVRTSDEAPKDALREHMDAADIECFAGEYEAGFSRLLGLISVTTGEEREQARQRLVDLFDVAGAQSDVVKSARRRLANLLF